MRNCLKIQRVSNVLLNSCYCIKPKFLSIESITSDFQAALEKLKSQGNNIDLDSITKLRLYGLYKQATEGPANESKRPSMFEPVARAKFDEWLKNNKLSKNEAMIEYTKTVMKLLSESVTGDNHPSVSTSNNRMKTNSLQDIAFPRRSATDSFSNLKLTTLSTSISLNGISNININRPNKGNSFNLQFWLDFNSAFETINNDNRTKVVILSGSNKNFSSGMDLEVFNNINMALDKESCESHKREGFENLLQFLQDTISLPEIVVVPVIAKISGYCIGGAVDLITSCDMRYCTKDSTFSIKETDLALVADIGTLQRLPKLIGHQKCLELAYTGRVFNGKEAEEMGLVLKCFDTYDELDKCVNDIAETIASKSPITIRGIKKSVLYSRDHSVKESLDQIKMWNSAHYMSNDVKEAFRAILSKEKPKYNSD